MLRNRFLLFLTISFLFALGGVLLNESSNPVDDQPEAIEKRIRAIIEEVDQEAQVILKDPTSVNWSLLNNSFFLVDSTEVLAWSSNQFSPDLRGLNSSDSFQLSRSNSGDFLFRTWRITATRSTWPT